MVLVAKSSRPTRSAGRLIGHRLGAVLAELGMRPVGRLGPGAPGTVEAVGLVDPKERLGAPPRPHLAERVTDAPCDAGYAGGDLLRRADRRVVVSAMVRHDARLEGHPLRPARARQARWPARPGATTVWCRGRPRCAARRRPSPAEAWCPRPTPRPARPAAPSTRTKRTARWDAGPARPYWSAVARGRNATPSLDTETEQPPHPWATTSQIGTAAPRSIVGAVGGADGVTRSPSVRPHGAGAAWLAARRAARTSP